MWISNYHLTGTSSYHMPPLASKFADTAWSAQTFHVLTIFVVGPPDVYPVATRTSPVSGGNAPERVIGPCTNRVVPFIFEDPVICLQAPSINPPYQLDLLVLPYSDSNLRHPARSVHATWATAPQSHARELVYTHINQLGLIVHICGSQDMSAMNRYRHSGRY